jgi:hypothetical protein
MSSTVAPIRPTTPQAGEIDSYRLLIFNSTGSEVLLCGENNRWKLPQVQIPKFTRTLEQINALVGANWGIATVLLFSECIPSKSSGFCFVALEAPLNCGRVPGLVWHPVHNVPSLLADAEQIAILESCHARVLQREGSSDTAPFGRLGWIYALEDWIRNVSGMDELVALAQLSGSEHTCLIRFETSSKTLWYKAIGQANPREFANITALSRWLPQYLPPVLAVNPDLNAWLMESGGETTLRERLDFDTWATVARRLANMQIESICRASELLKLGCIDVQSGALLNPLPSFFEFMGTLMQQQVKNPPPPLTRAQLSEIADVLREALSELSEIGLPNVIGHSDFNPGNILISGDHSVFVDWDAAHVGSPVLTLEYLISHYRKNCTVLPGQEYLLRQAYWEQWRSTVSEPRARRAQELAPLVAVYASAIASNSWRDPDRLMLPGVPGYLRSLARIMQQEAQLLAKRRTLA